LFEASQRSFAVGERIQVTRPWTVRKGIKIANRAQATIESLDANGQGVIVFDDGRRVKWNANQMPHVDYSYASTSYSLQFATAEQVLVHLDTGDSRVRSLLDRALVYVGTSRGANEIRIYSDDKETLLSDNSPVLRQTQKPVALSPVERNSISTSSAA
jgi:ATP-dependent exoDNAse (exonuclease V) alpha subunit